MDVDLVLLGKSVVLPNTALPRDTRINIQSIGRGNYVEFIQNKFRSNHTKCGENPECMHGTCDRLGSTIILNSVLNSDNT